MEMIKFEGKEYPTLLLNFPFGERQISTEKLNDNLMNVDGSYVSENARLIDESIFYFVDEENLKLDEAELTQLILSEI
ncbi:hypothetical protein CYPRO_0582 [Cyclonatronum proteinivorum]|uniref:Uncharacterized protein n=1 Tax=Cyclonatronum proteinivorum TaxID=1457365 RepID=A0A345UHB5_9BACT|nr:hypothetical protein [Cyclonatronum proteinivorum]AXI99866.1 hypothetical protein CYPRO_0582 [Cyclonatronum proteinivorum]